MREAVDAKSFSDPGVVDEGLCVYNDDHFLSCPLLQRKVIPGHFPL